MFIIRFIELKTEGFVFNTRLVFGLTKKINTKSLQALYV